MKKQDIIKIFLNKGFQLEPSSVEYLFENQGDIEKILTLLDSLEKKEPIITKDVIFSLLNRGNLEIEVLRELKKINKLKVEDFVRIFTSRYEKISKFFTNRFELINLISINKISNKTKKFSLIGAVVEKDEKNNSLVVEDTTGKLTVFLDEKIKNVMNQIIFDEIIGIVCEKNDLVTAKNIFFPDIPLKRVINKTKEDVFCFFISNIHMDNPNFKKKSYENFVNWINSRNFKKFYIFVLGGVSSRKNDIIDFFSVLPKNSIKIFLRGDEDPEVDVGDVNFSKGVFLKIEKNLIFLVLNGVLLEKYKKIWENCSIEEIVLNLLKKRNINPILNKELYEEDFFVLDIIPDFFVLSNFHHPFFMNYKGTTILSTGSFISSPVFWLSNLRTRETIKIDFT